MSEYNENEKQVDIDNDEDWGEEDNSFDIPPNPYAKTKKKSSSAIAAVIFTGLAVGAGVFFVPKIINNNQEQEELEMSNVVDLSIDDLFISKFYDTSSDSEHDLDITIKNNSKEDVYAQTIITIWGKTLSSIPSEGLEGDDYVDARYFHVYDEEMMDKYKDCLYYILEDSTGNISVAANEYKESDGKIIAIRYILPLSNNKISESKISNNYKFYIDEKSPSYYYSNIELIASVKVQGKTKEKANWLVCDTSQLFSNDISSEYEETTDSSDVSLNETNSDDNNFIIPEEQYSPDELMTSTQPIETETSIQETISTENNLEIADENPIETEPEDIYPTSMSISTSNTTMEVGSTQALEITFIPENTTVKNIIWNSSDSNIVSVIDGVLTANSAGIATITATSANNMQLECVVTVVDSSTTTSEETANVLTGLRFDAANITMGIGNTYTLSVSVEPSSITSLAGSWSSSNPEVASIANDGTITALSSGETTITLTSDNGISTSCTVVVN